MLTWRWRCHGVCCSARISFEQRSSLQDYPRCFLGSECKKVFGYVLISLLTSRSLLANRRKSRTCAWRAFELIFNISNLSPTHIKVWEANVVFQTPHHLLYHHLQSTQHTVVARETAQWTTCWHLFWTCKRLKHLGSIFWTGRLIVQDTAWLRNTRASSSRMRFVYGFLNMTIKNELSTSNGPCRTFPFSSSVSTWASKQSHTCGESRVWKLEPSSW